jgi:hypothetical protein
MKDKNLLLKILILIAIAGSNYLHAQRYCSTKNDSAGIYLTYQNFETGKTTNAFKPYQKNIPYGRRDFSKIKTLS